MPHMAITQIYQPIYLHITLLLTMTCHQQLVMPPWLVSTSLVLWLDESLAQFTSRRQHLYGELSWSTNNPNSTTILTVYYKQFSIVVPGTIHHHPEMRPSMWCYVAGRFKATKKSGWQLPWRATLWFSAMTEQKGLWQVDKGALPADSRSLWDGVDDWIKLVPL